MIKMVFDTTAGIIVKEMDNPFAQVQSALNITPNIWQTLPTELQQRIVTSTLDTYMSTELDAVHDIVVKATRKLRRAEAQDITRAALYRSHFMHTVQQEGAKRAAMILNSMSQLIDKLMLLQGKDNLGVLIYPLQGLVKKLTTLEDTHEVLTRSEGWYMLLDGKGPTMLGKRTELDAIRTMKMAAEIEWSRVADEVEDAEYPLDFDN